jgi:2-amino-4-hydroxy-6-hydroxymethyldihydropteridine diphosphokinase
MSRALLALGSNLGDRAAALDAAENAIAALPHTRLLAKSGWRPSAAVGGPPGQPGFLNGAVLIETSLPPLELFNRLQQIEQAAGRVRDQRWGPRIIDLDLLIYDDFVADSHRLVVPHPRLAFRRFVLEPAAQIAGDMIPPTSDLTIAELLSRLTTTRAYLAIMGPPGSGKTRLAREIADRSGCRLLLDTAENVGPVEAISAGPELAREIEFLARRSRRLTRATWPADGTWTVSDFWLDQSLAWCEAQQGDAARSHIETAYRQYCVDAVAPRFLAVLDADDSGDANRDAGFEGRLHSAMRALASQGGQPPVLWLSSGDWQESVAELLAVLAG